MAAFANGSICSVPAPAAGHFTPSASTIICNALWFISLGLNLTCALIATLFERWARDFLHKANMRSAFVNRARIYPYLYHGMKRFQVHTVVEHHPAATTHLPRPLFSGFVAFLLFINIVITIVAAALLLIVTAVYSVLTLFSLQPDLGQR
ncbi:hypothetical protein B0H19DRAFT_1268916 [Mycena capillaripes]|nr:hypothetical protein B0H19DRAFT_1268916 [Mycena capillaripes]